MDRKMRDTSVRRVSGGDGYGDVLGTVYSTSLFGLKNNRDVASCGLGRFDALAGTGYLYFFEETMRFVFVQLRMCFQFRFLTPVGISTSTAGAQLQGRKQGVARAFPWHH